MFEKVNSSHPDKMCDRLAGALVDIAYAQVKDPKIAVEVLAGHGKVYVIIETSLTSDELRREYIHQAIDSIFGKGVEGIVTVIPQDAHLAENQEGAIRCGDNGIFMGCPTTHEQRLLTEIAESIFFKYGTDGKYIIRGRGRLAEPVFDVTVCQSHMSKEDEQELREHLKTYYGINGDIIINPLGPWTGGPDVDCGATNRKLGSDMGDAVTGGGLHGKDLSKADVSVNIVCHLKAVRAGQRVSAMCSIGDESVTFQYSSGKTETESYTDIVEQAKQYIHDIGGFEEFAMWGLIRPRG